MSNLNDIAIAKYSNNFLREVEERVEEGEWVKMCMQCGVCAGSCPFGPHWEHSPQKLFMMIRAGKRDDVLRSDSMWMCTSCYNCVVRCPRMLPAKRLNPFELLKGHECEDKAGIQRMLKKAHELEGKRRGLTP